MNVRRFPMLLQVLYMVQVRFWRQPFHGFPWNWAAGSMILWFFSTKKWELDFRIEHAYFGVSVSLLQWEILCLFATPPVKYGDSAKVFYQFRSKQYTEIPAKQFPAFLQHHQDSMKTWVSVPSIPNEIWNQKVNVCSSREPDGSHREVKIPSKSTCGEHCAVSTGWLHLTEHG